MTVQEQSRELWEQLEALIASGDVSAAELLLSSISASEKTRILHRLNEQANHQLVELLTPLSAAELVEDLPDQQACGGRNPGTHDPGRGRGCTTPAPA